MDIWRNLSGASKTALICGLLGFIISLTTTQTSTINGQFNCSHTDYGALMLGAITGLSGGVGVSAARRIPQTRMLNLGVSGMGLALGAIHMMRGFGQLGGPCG